jgi:glycosyltransferase involved in cell wall biosynthesis
MNELGLSYVMTTFNKLSYLKLTLPLLISAREIDEEIVVVDGGSTDGTPEYLQQLFQENKIQQFISEKDNGEAHGTNKGMLMAKGALIKIITDDDVFDYKLIQRCRAFMEEHPAVDILGYDGLGCLVSKTPEFTRTNFIDGFRLWQSERTPFLFSGLSFLIRRSSLSYLGLLSTGFTIVDMEYSIRVSSLKTNIAFYTGTGFVNIVNPDSNSQKFYSAIRSEQKLLSKIYPAIKNNFKLKSPILSLKEKLSRFKPGRKAKRSRDELFTQYRSVLEMSAKKLSERSNGTYQFLTSDAGNK